MKKTMIAVQIREDVEFGKGDIRQYNDTLYYTQAEYDALKKGDIDFYDNWSVWSFHKVYTRNLAAYDLGCFNCYSFQFRGQVMGYRFCSEAHVGFPVR